MEFLRFLAIFLVFATGIYLVFNIYIGVKTGALRHSDSSSQVVREKNPLTFWCILILQFLLSILIFSGCLIAYSK